MGPVGYSLTGLYYTKAFEGCKLTSYQDTKGIWTIGWAHTGESIVEGLTWTQQQADNQAENDYILAWLRSDQWLNDGSFKSLDEPRQCAIADMVFNMGFGGMLGFVQCRAAMISKNYSLASWNILWNKTNVHTEYFTDVPNRCSSNAFVILNGKFPAAGDLANV